MASDVRPFRLDDSDDWTLFRRIDELAFGYANPEPDDSPELAVLDHERTLIGEVDGEAAGIASAFGFGVTVPGGATVPTAGTTWVGVLPTHRRQGLLRTMMTRHLRDSAERGDVLAALWASEPAIYGRFGYGVASRALRVVLAAGDLPPTAPPGQGIRVSVHPPDTVRAELAAVYERAAALRPGATTRDARWWDRSLHDPEHRRGDASPRRALVARAGDEVLGYATYSTAVRWTDAGTPDGTLAVRELVAPDPAARAALWRVLLGHDLISRVEWRNAPTDEPLLEWVHDRGAVRGVADQMYVRLLDLPAALVARTYSAPFEIVLEVTDPLAAGNSGRWWLRADGDGSAECVRTTRPADAELDVRHLGATYLGAKSLVALAGAGLLTVHDPARLATASRALRHEPDAWCPEIF